MKSIHVIYMGFNCFQASIALCIFMSTHANSWIKVAARQNTIWIRFGNRRAVRRRRAEAGMALTAIGEFTQWGGVADCSGSRTMYMESFINKPKFRSLDSMSKAVVTREFLRNGLKYICLQNLRNKLYSIWQKSFKNSFWTHLPSTMFWQYIASLS